MAPEPSAFRGTSGCQGPLLLSLLPSQQERELKDGRGDAGARLKRVLGFGWGGVIQHAAITRGRWGSQTAKFLQLMLRLFFFFNETEFKMYPK